MSSHEDFGTEPISPEEENLQNAVDTFEREINARGGDIRSAALEVLRMMTGN